MSTYPTARNLGPLFAPRTGDELKREGIERVTNANADFVRVMRIEAERIARENGTVHVDDVRARAISLGLSPKSSACWGSIFAEKNKWEIVGWRPSEFPGNHSHQSPVRKLVA